MNRFSSEMVLFVAGLLAFGPVAYAQGGLPAARSSDAPAAQSAQKPGQQRTPQQKHDQQAKGQPHTSAQNPQALQSVVVTAEHRETLINKTPITIDALNTFELKQLHITKIKDLQRVSPGLSIHSPFGNNGYPAISIRGMNSDNFTEFSPQSVGVYMDGIYLTSPPMLGFSMFDLERVEVLKGPQGTLYGRNTIGGAIRLIPIQPTFTPEGYVDVNYGARYQHLGVDGAVGGPLSDTVAYRVSLHAVRQWQGPFHTGNPNGSSQGQLRKAALRAQLLWKPSDAFSARLSLHGGVDHSDTWPFSQVAALVPQGQPNAGQICAPFLAGNLKQANAQCVDISGYHNTSGNPYDNPLSIFGRNHNKTFGGDLHINWDMGFAKLTSITGYDYLTRSAGYDEDAGPNQVIDSVRSANVHQFSEEVRLASPTDNDSRLDWQTGIFFQRSRLLGSPIFVSNEKQWFGVASADYDNLITSVWGIFGQINYQLADKWKLTVGARESLVHRHFDFRGTSTPLLPVVGNPVVTYEASNHLNQSAWSGKVGLSYTPTSSLLLYTSIARGFNAGSFSPYFLNSPQSIEPTKPATNIAYEAGFKWRTAQNRIELNGAAYYNDWKDIQLTEIVNRTGINAPYLTNADGASIYGGELELKARPTPAWTLSMGTGYIHTKLRDLLSPDLFGNVINLKGRPLANSPEWSFNANTNYRFTLGNGYHLVPQINVLYESKIYHDLLGTKALITPSHLVADASLTLDHFGEWHVKLWVHNLTNREFITEGYQVVAAGMAGVVWNQPRTYGVTFGVNFL